MENLTFAVLDRDQTTSARTTRSIIAGSRYFIERPPIADYADLDRRMRSGELSLAIEIPPGFGRDVARGTPVEIGAWIDGSMPMRAETIQGYVQGMHAHWLAARARTADGAAAASGFARIETRYRYNPDVKSLPAMVPAVIPLLLLLIPAMLTALAWCARRSSARSSTSTSRRPPGWNSCSASSSPTWRWRCSTSCC